MKSPDQRQVLMISYYFPPVKAIGTLRNFSVAQGLLTQEWKVEIITTNNNIFLPKQQLPNLDGLRVFSTHTFDFRRFLFRFSRQKKTQKAEGGSRYLYQMGA